MMFLSNYIALEHQAVNLLEHRKQAYFGIMKSSI